MVHRIHLVPLMIVAMLSATRAGADDEPPADRGRGTAIRSAVGYAGFLEELAAADAVVTLKVLEATSSDERDPVTNTVVSVTVRGEVINVFKGGWKVGQVVEVFVPYADLDRRPGADVAHLYFGYVPLVGQPATFLLAAGEPWRATNLLTSLVEAKHNRAYVRASAAQGAEAALRLAELFCEVSFELLRDKGPVYGYSRTLCEDVKRHWRELDPASEPFRRRVVERYAVATLEQCARPTLLTNTEGWDAVVWVACCMDDAGRREAVRRLVAAYGASVERMKKLPPRRPQPTHDPRAGAPAPDPRDQEAILQAFLLSAMKLVIEPGWRDGPPGEALGHLIPYDRLIDRKLSPEAVLPMARAFAAGREGEPSDAVRVPAQSGEPGDWVSPSGPTGRQ